MYMVSVTAPFLELGFYESSITPGRLPAFLSSLDPLFRD